MSRTPLESDKPFFSRSRTKFALASLADQVAHLGSPLTIYAGAGVTIDRSALSWRGMVEGILREYVSDPQVIDEIFRQNEVVAAATLAEAFYLRDYGEGNFRDRMVDKLRWMLYGPGDWQAGRLADEVASLCASIQAYSGGCVVATPNYDDYLIAAMKKAKIDVSIERTTRTDSPLNTSGVVRSAEWVKTPSVRQALFRGSNTAIQLHGLIPRSPGGKTYPPVISEIDYVKSEPYTFRALRALLSDSCVLMVGTSLTDRPLLQALDKTRDSRFPRFALVPLGGSRGEPEARSRDLRKYQLERFARYNVTPIFVDYYFQVAQFLVELSRLLDEVKGEELENLEEEIVSQLTYNSYGQRLVNWAEDWRFSREQLLNADSGTDSTPFMLDDILNDVTEKVLVEIRIDLDLSASEVTKLEFWVRDDPRTQRGLRLWSSTVSRHFQEESARRAQFARGSEISAVSAFVEGRPWITRLGPDESPSQRWRTYLAVPVWLAGKRYGSLPVGALVVASMRPFSESGLIRLSRRASMQSAIKRLVTLGELLSEVPDRR